MSDFINICNSLEIPYCFCFGTALGLYREKNFIASDGDIDVFIQVNTSLLKRFICLMSQKGFAYNLIPGAASGYNIHFLKYSIPLDVWLRTHKNFYIDFKNLSYVHFHNLTIPIPGNTDKYLSLCYGDWRTPNNYPVSIRTGKPADQLHK